ncbi:glycosyltransferase [Qipengyuania sp. JC766]|uniref:glycosyltransferase n=1 Tax=Qipengyuania sp. JC766 TaxID=3232139 RepID=UPI00345A5975
MSKELLVCDLTQSWSASGGGGITTYLKQKREHFLANTPHRLMQIIPGPEDRITKEGRYTRIEVAGKPVIGSPNYRWISRTGKVYDLLAEYQPDILESLCPWVLPWVAIRHRWRFPQTALVAGYRTDFPNAHVDRVAKDMFGDAAGQVFVDLSYFYARHTYRWFDRVYTLNSKAKDMFAGLDIHQTGVLPLGVNLDRFSPDLRDPDYRQQLGLPPGDGPLLIYAGRIDNEKGAAVLVDMFRQLPPDLGAAMVLVGDGKLRTELMEKSHDLPIAFPGYQADRGLMARALASADIYVSGMQYETFGISVLEAQASGLPVVGVNGGAMSDRVPAGTGLLGPIDDAKAMADNVVRAWREDYPAMRAAAIANADRSNRWKDTFDQLVEVEYKAALEARDRRLGQAGKAVSGTWQTN